MNTNRLIEVASELRAATARYLSAKERAARLYDECRAAERERDSEELEVEKVKQRLSAAASGYEWNPETCRMELDGVPR